MDSYLQGKISYHHQKKPLLFWTVDVKAFIVWDPWMFILLNESFWKIFDLILNTEV